MKPTRSKPKRVPPDDPLRSKRVMITLGELDEIRHRLYRSPDPGRNKPGHGAWNIVTRMMKAGGWPVSEGWDR